VPMQKYTLLHFPGYFVVELIIFLNTHRGCLSLCLLSPERPWVWWKWNSFLFSSQYPTSHGWGEEDLLINDCTGKVFFKTDDMKNLGRFCLKARKWAGWSLGVTFSLGFWKGIFRVTQQ
jgi:hypothetical protein